MISLIFIAFALIGLVLAGTAWYVFLRPVPEQIAQGEIVEKTFRPAHTITRSPSGTRRQDWSSTEIHIPDQIEVAIKLVGAGEVVRYAFGAAGGEAFEVGQQVRVRYQARGVPGLWQRVYVLEMRAD